MTLPPVISIVGTSGSGKTAFLEKLIAELTNRGLKIGTIKHNRRGFDVDRPGKDSWRHAQAGSKTVVLSSPESLTVIKRLDQEVGLDDIVEAYMADLDLVLTEGYKSGAKKKIEVSRRERGQLLVSAPEDLLAIVSDQTFDLPVPQCGLDDARGVADLIGESVLAGTSGVHDGPSKDRP